MRSNTQTPRHDVDMGQYHYTVNLDKHEYLDPHQLGDGLKLVEQCGHVPGGINDALHLLLAVSSGRGGGDFPTDSPLVGSWGGDRIAVVGDYGDDRDLKKKFRASTIYHRCKAADGIKEDEDDEEKDPYPGLPLFADITPALIPVLEEAYGIIYYGSGWRQRVSVFKAFEGLKSTCAASSEFASPGDSRLALFEDGTGYRVNDLIEEAKRRLGGDTRAPLVGVESPQVARR